MIELGDAEIRYRLRNGIFSTTVFSPPNYYCMKESKYCIYAQQNGYCSITVCMFMEDKKYG